ncbi:MAG TPA: ABC transporter permease [Gemmatimonadales bacterium]|nr:ABC transporter permease [Gemmatimonadales bacterium]
MRKILAVVRREFVERVRTKWFWIGTVLGPLFFGGMILVRLLNGEHSGVERRVAVIDQTTGGTGARLVDGLSASLERFHFVRVPTSPRAVDSLTNVVIAKDLDGFLLVSDSTLDDGSVEYRGSNVSSLADMEELRSTLGRQVFAVRLERHGIDPAVVRDAELTVAMATHKIRGTKVTGESGEQAFTLSFAMAIILFLAIVLYGVNVMSSVLEEKTTRIVEVLVSSLRPFELMLGKVLGAGAVGIVQLTVWLLSVKVLAGQQERLAAWVGVDHTGAQAPALVLPQVPAATMAVFVVYFLLGYFLYAAVFAAVGAISGTEQEARQAQTPVTLLLMVPYLSVFAILNDPNSISARWFTFVPFWSPVAAPVRWSAAPIPPAELATSILILLLSVLLVTWVAARIYRVGILMTGKRPSVREIIRWVRAG